MPRPPRIDFPDAVYHVTSRGNGRADIFHGDDDRQRFLAQLGHHLHLCAIDLYALVLMDNHIHLLCRTPRANLSYFMRSSRRTVSLEEIDAAESASLPTRCDVAFRAWPHGRAGQGGGRRVGGATGGPNQPRDRRAVWRVRDAVAANRRRLATRPEVLEVVGALGRKLRKWKRK